MILQKVVSKLTDRHDESCYRGMRREAPHPSVRFFAFKSNSRKSLKVLLCKTFRDFLGVLSIKNCWNILPSQSRNRSSSYHRLQLSISNKYNEISRFIYLKQSFRFLYNLLTCFLTFGMGISKAK